MKKKNAFALALSVAFLASCASEPQYTVAEEDVYSGFLSDYSGLELTESPVGIEYKRWLSDDVAMREYRKTLLGDVRFYPPPKPEDRLDRANLTQIKNYFTRSLVDAFEQQDLLAKTPGPGIAMIEFTVGNVVVEARDGMGQIVVPPAAILKTQDDYEGSPYKIVTIIFEAEITDSETGELIGVAVFEGSGSELLDNTRVLSFGNLRPMIDHWSLTFAAHAKSATVTE